MKTYLTNISFNGGINSETPQKPKRRVSALGSITEPIDNGDPRTAITTRLNGKVMPTPFEDCFEKMSFEEPDEDNMWRDAQYQEDFERVSKYGDDLTPHIIFERPFIDQYYSEDDVPLADSVIRRTLGFRHLTDINLNIDTQIDSYGRKVLEQINYNENILPRLLKGVDYATQEEFAKLAATYKESGHPTQNIIRAIERCYLQGHGNHYGIASINLFEFLVENPGLRSLVVAKNGKGEEIFDKACANYFSIFHKYLPNRETIKSTLDLCKTDYNGTPLVNRKLCEIVILTRQKSAHGIKDPRADYSNSYYDAPMRRFEKYVDKSTPLTELDIKLIQKIKPNNILDDSMYEVAKTLLSSKMTVEYVLENIDKLGKRKSEINKLLSNLNEITLDKDKPAIGGIRTVLNNEFEESVENPDKLKEKSLLFNSTKRLIKKGLETPDIALVLSKIRDINKRIPLSTNFADEFISVLEEKNDSGKIVIGKTLADILTKLVLTSREITEIDREIISLIKEHKSQIPTLPSLVNGMLNRTSDKDEILVAIKEKISAKKTPKQEEEIIEQPKSKPQNRIIVNGKLIQSPLDWEKLTLGDDNIIIDDSKGYDDSYISQVISNKNQAQINIQPKERVKKTLTPEEASSEIAKIEKILLGSARMLEMTDAEIIQVLKRSNKEKQSELIDLVNKMLDEWRSSKEILTAVRDESKK